jgi:hypothetical protein
MAVRCRRTNAHHVLFGTSALADTKRSTDRLSLSSDGGEAPRWGLALACTRSEGAAGSSFGAIGMSPMQSPDVTR